jgi:hypothetical protein
VPFTTCDDFPTLDPIYDDFEDGDRAAAPTASLVDFTGSNVSESGGYLVFDAADGGIEIDLGGGVTPYIRDEVFVSTLIPDNTIGGSTYFSAQFDSDLAQLVDSGVDETTFLANDTSSGFGITLAGYLDGSGAIATKGAQLGIFNSYLGCQTIFFNDLNPHWAQNVNSVTGDPEPLDLYGYDVIGGGAACTDKVITGDIILRLELTQGYLRPSYSIDGGVTYNIYENWDSAAVFGSSFTVPASFKSSAPGVEPAVYDGAVATVFGQTAITQLASPEEFIPYPIWGLGLLGGILLIIVKVVRGKL